MMSESVRRRHAKSVVALNLCSRIWRTVSAVVCPTYLLPREFFDLHRINVEPEHENSLGRAPTREGQPDVPETNDPEHR